MKPILCLGDACADLVIPYGAAKQGGDVSVQYFPGGASANTASGLGRLGVPCLFLGKAGDDYFGRRMKAALAQDGVDTRCFALDPALCSVMILAVIDETGDRFPFLVPRVRPSHLELYDADLPASLLGEIGLVHTTGLMLFENPAAEAVCGFLERCRAAGIPVSLDINLRLETARQNDRCLRRALECATYVLGSGEEELAPLAGLSDPLAAAASFVRPGRAVVCRLGTRGAAALDSTGTSFCPAFPVPVADTLGAGDAYNSGFLYALYNGMPLAAANRRGCAAAALNLTQPGARNCPTAAALEAFLAQQS